MLCKDVVEPRVDLWRHCVTSVHWMKCHLTGTEPHGTADAIVIALSLDVLLNHLFQLFIMLY